MIVADMQCVAYTPYVPKRDRYGKSILPPSMSVRRFVGYPVSYTEIGCAFGYAVGDDHSPCDFDWREYLARLDWREEQASIRAALSRSLPGDQERRFRVEWGQR